MRTQFFYTRKEATKDGQTLFRKDSFNLTAVIRSIEMADGSVLVLLNDIHERTQETPNINPRNNKMSGVTRKRDTFQSEIYLSREDGLRFYRQTTVDYDNERVFNLEVANDGVQEVTGEESLSGDARGTRE